MYKIAGMAHKLESFKTATFYYVLKEAEEFLLLNKKRVDVQKEAMKPVGERDHLG